MFLILADMVLAMVLIEDDMTLMMMIEKPEHKPTTAMAMAMPK